MKTIRNELAKRLRVYWKVYREKPESYNAVLGIGKLDKSQNRPFTGWGIDDRRYINGKIQ